MKIALGADHAGFDVKDDVKSYLESIGHKVIDKGTFSADSVDYPQFGHDVGIAVSNGDVDRGIVICGSGIGISIAANKINGIRAALCTSSEHAKMSRLHNDANVLALGARMTDYDVLINIIDIWLSTEFEGGRHQQRVEKIEVS
jgi:ribose 5-phosphate isomerase B